MVKLYKLTGTGNHFLLIDLRDKRARKSVKEYFHRLSRKQIARKLCNPFQSVGADGLLFLENSQLADLKWDFYNADGSRAEMCGNAARCVGRYVLSLNKSCSHFTLETRAGVVGITLPLKKKYKFSDPAVVDIEMPKINIYEPNLTVKVGARNIRFDFINSGVPHAVVALPHGKNTKNIFKNVDKLGIIVNKIRSLPQFKKHGTNVTFYSAKNKKSIRTLTFERGVVGYTQACGTGAVAAAVSFTQNKSHIIKAYVPGGLLIINLTEERPHLIGLGEFVAEIYLK